MAAKKLTLGCLALFVGTTISNAALVSLNASDAVNASSYNSSGHWNNSQAQLHCR